MFYRYTASGSRRAIDLDDTYAGQTLFLLGGSPKLKELNLDLLRLPGIVTMGMNNVPCVYKPNLWLCLDKPPCFSPHIYASPEIQKFTMITRRWEEVPGTDKKVCEMPNMYFFGTKSDHFTYSNFLDQDRDLVWWKSVFPAALQLAYRLGFRTVYLVGCGFHMPKEQHYAWDTQLNDYQRNYSQRTYSRDVDRLGHLKPVFDAKGFSVISSTPGGMANDVLGYLPLDSAISRVVRNFPSVADTIGLKHSSELSRPPKD